MEPTANSPRSHDTRTPPGTPRVDSAPIDSLSSWDGPGTAYTVIPRPSVPSPSPARPAIQTAQQEPAEALPTVSFPRPTPKPSLNWLLIVGMAACALLVALWKAGALDNTLVTPANHEPSPQPPAPTQLTESRVENTVTVTQEPMDDEPALPPSAEPALDELPDPAVYDSQLSPNADTVGQAAPTTQSVEKPTPASATGTAPAPAAAQKQSQQPAPSSPVITAQKIRPAPTDAAPLTGTKPASPAKQRSTPATATVGTLIVAVQPWAEVWVDGRKRGISPPLLKLQLPPGLYTVELRNPDLPSYGQKVQITTGQSVTLRHSFQ